MTLVQRGRHVRHRPLIRGAMLPFVLIAGALLGSAGFLIGSPPSRALPPSQPFVHTPADTRHLLAATARELPPPPEGHRLDLLDSAWRTHTDIVDLRFDLVGPMPGEHPAPPPGSGEGRRVVYSNAEQRVWLVDGAGVVLDSYLVSGRRGVPAPGTYRVFSRSEVAWAGHDGISMRYMVRFAWGQEQAIGFHSIPLDRGGAPIQTEEDLGDFRSAGCVRQAVDDARRLYLWAEEGTRVVVTP